MFIVSPSIPLNTIAPLTHARIGYNNFVTDATVTADTEADGFPADAVKRQTTWERWKPTGTTGQKLIIDNGSTTDDTDYIGIAAHTLGSSGAEIEIAASYDNITYAAIGSITPTDDNPIMMIFPPVPYRYWKITIVSATTEPTIGVVYLGQVLEMERPIYIGHSPIDLSRQTMVRPTESEKGQWLGRSVIRYGLQTSYDWSNLTADWYRANFDLFVQSARFRPFFIAWRPETYPESVAYGWTSQDIQPKNQGPRDLMSVSMSVSAYADE